MFKLLTTNALTFFVVMIHVGIARARTPQWFASSENVGVVAANAPRFFFISSPDRPLNLIAQPLNNTSGKL